MSNLKERLQQIKDEVLDGYDLPDFVDETIDEICKRYAEEVIKEASEVACDSLELYPSEYKKLEQSIIKLIEEL